MTGTITRRHFLTVAREFSIRTAIRLLISRKPVALTVLISL